ncbi:hypothetical protein [Streptomyces sp. SD31]|uniref:hypothetical protein n=1 Tax=Streptomyces sp. SD31 TaxID=3452208 RepID=UPI003F8B72B1
MFAFRKGRTYGTVLIDLEASVREPQVSSLVHFGVERPLDDFGLGELFPAGLTGFHDGA